MLFVCKFQFVSKAGLQRKSKTHSELSALTGQLGVYEKLKSQMAPKLTGACPGPFASEIKLNCTSNA
jgi:hypothetical protein